MKISQREKIMLIALCVILVGALIFIFVLKPMFEEKASLQTEVKNAKAEWEEITDPVVLRFLSENDAELIWQLPGAVLTNKLNNLIYDKSYLLGNQITDLMGEAAELGDTSILPKMPKFALVEKILDEYIYDYIEISSYAPSPITDIEYQKNNETYLISQCSMAFNGFTCVGNDPNSFYMMLNKMEKSGYIVIQNWTFNPNDNTGNITFLVLMTPGDLSEYSVTQCTNPDCLRYNDGDASTCKYCGEDLVQEVD